MEGTTFFTLPAEIRLQIYALCAEPPATTRWMYGGRDSLQTFDFNPFFGLPEYPRHMLLRGEGLLAKNLLLTSRKAYDEAVVAMYKHIIIQIHGFPWRCITDLDYWFGDHPFRFTQRIEICKDGRTDTNLVGYKITGRVLVEDFVAVLNQMPNLLELDVFLQYGPWTLRALQVTELKDAPNSDYFKLFFIKEYLRPEVKYRLRYTTHQVFKPQSPYACSLQDDLIHNLKLRAWEVESYDRDTGLRVNLLRPTPNPGKVGDTQPGILPTLYPDDVAWFKKPDMAGKKGNTVFSRMWNVIGRTTALRTAQK